MVPTFSVIVPAYEAAATVGETIASALEQTLAPLEVIVCDDGSTDDIEGAVAPFRDRIVFLRKANGGAASARNAALGEAKGDFVVPLDSDDVFLPRRLEALGALAAARPDLDLLSTDVYFELGGTVIGRFYDDNAFAVAGQRTAILESCFVGWPAVRRERLAAVGGFDEALATCDDWDAWIHVILDGATAGLVPEPLVRYRLRTGSLSSDRVRVFRERVSMLDKAGRHPSLSFAERQALAGARRRAHTRAVEAELRASLLAGWHRGGRSRALEAARDPAIPFRMRCIAAGGAIAPGLVARVLRRRQRPLGVHDRRADARG